jgi:hypothetical protein
VVDLVRRRGIRELVPDPGLRATLEQEMPRLPLAYFEAVVPVPEGWDRRPCAYLLLGREAYGGSAAQARTRGWAVAEIHGAHHLALATDPAAVASALLRLEGDLLGPSSAPSPPELRVKRRRG